MLFNDFFVSATGLDPSGLFSFPGQSSIDLLGFNISRFERIRGPNQHDTMAYSFTGKKITVFLHLMKY